MILERFEPKKSRKVPVGAPGRPFKVAKGTFSARGLGILTVSGVSRLKKCRFDLEDERRDGHVETLEPETRPWRL